MKYLTLIFILGFFGNSQNSLAQPWAVGVSVSPRPGISLQVKPQNPNQAFHIGVHYSKNKVFQINSDYQHFFSQTGSYNQSLTGFYTGLGVRGESFADSPYKEEFMIRFPLGIQWEHIPAHLQIFAEAVGILGPIPNTKFLASGALGMRSYF